MNIIKNQRSRLIDISADQSHINDRRDYELSDISTYCDWYNPVRYVCLVAIIYDISRWIYTLYMIYALYMCHYVTSIIIYTLCLCCNFKCVLYHVCRDIVNKHTYVHKQSAPLKQINSVLNAMDTIFRYIYLPQVYKATKIGILCIVKTVYEMWNKRKNSSKLQLSHKKIYQTTW